MSASREKDQKDHDLEDLVKVIDTALTSNNPAVQNSLRSLLLVATIVSAEHPDQVVRHGPLARVFEDYRHLGRRLSDLEDEVQQLRRMALTKTDAPYAPRPLTTGWPGTNDPTKLSPMCESTWSAGDDLIYQGAQSIPDSLSNALEAAKGILKDYKQ